MRVAFRAIFLALACGFFAAGCASRAEIDRSYVNHPAMDLRKPNTLGEPSPGSGLRNFEKSGGSGGCTVCAH